MLVRLLCKVESRRCRPASVPNLALQSTWAENEYGVVPFVSDTLGSMSWESAATLRMFVWCHARLEAELFVKDWGDVDWANHGASALAEALKRSFRTWDARRSLIDQPVQRWPPAHQTFEVPQELGCPFPGHRDVRASVSLLQQRVMCERKPDLSTTSAPAGGLCK